MKWLTKLINKQIEAYFDIYIPTAERQREIERIRIIDFCMAQIVASNLRLDTLILELRRFESLPSVDELQKKTDVNFNMHFEEIMRRHDLLRQGIADEVLKYRERNPPPKW